MALPLQTDPVGSQIGSDEDDQDNAPPPSSYTMPLDKGMRSNNPGNLGISPALGPGAERRFASPEEGIAAIGNQLDRYVSGQFNGQPINTVRGIVSTYSPPQENPTNQLIQRASMHLGVDPDQPLDWQNPDIRRGMVEATLLNEHGGRMPVHPDVISTALGATHEGPEVWDNVWQKLNNIPADSLSLPQDASTATVSGTPGDWDKVWDQLQRVRAPIDGFPVPPNPGTLETLQHAATYIPKMLGRAVATGLGWRQDLTNLADQVMEPLAFHAAQGLRSITGQEPLSEADRASLNQQMGPPGSHGLLPQPTSEFFRGMFGDKANTALPSEVGDTNRVAHYLEELGMPALQVAGAGLPSTIAAGKTIGGTIGKLAGLGGIGAFTFGAGNVLAEDVLGSEGGSIEKQAEALTFGAVAEAARLGLLVATKNGVGALREYAPSFHEKYIRGIMGPEANIRANIDNPAAALANMKKPQDMVEGMKLPAMTMTEDPGAQALMQLHVHHNRKMQGEYNDIIDGNQAAIGKAEKNVVLGPGTPQDTMSYFQKSLENDRQAMTDRVNDAGDEAQRNFEAAIRDAAAPADSLLAKEAIGRATGTALGEADNDLKAFADARWQRARDLGVEQVQVQNPQNMILNQLSALKANAERINQGDRFPDATLAPLYKAGNDMNVGQLREVASNLESDIRGERKLVSSPFAQGDPKALRWMSQSAGAINDAIDQSISASGPDNLMAYRQATAATKNYYQLMHSGVVGKLRGMDLEGGEAVPPALTMQKLVPGGLAGADATRDLFGVIHAANSVKSVLQGAGIPTTHPADTLVQLTQQQLRQDFADAMNTGGFQHGQKWLSNNSVALQAFPQLKQEAQAAVDSRQSHFELQQGMNSYDKDLDKSAANNFLNGNVGKETDYVFRSKNPAQAASNLLDMTAGDPTGAASRGLARDLFDRMSAESKDAEGNYRPGAVLSFWREHAPVFQELAKRNLIDFRVTQQIINSYRGLDRMTAEPGRVVVPPDISDLSLAGLARKAANFVGASVGRHMDTGTIQVPGITSQIAGQIFDKLSPLKARDLQFEMMKDPSILQKILDPSGSLLEKEKLVQRTIGLPPSQREPLPPYVAAFPAVVSGTLGKQTGPETQNNAGNQFLPQGPRPSFLHNMGLPVR